MQLGFSMKLTLSSPVEYWFIRNTQISDYTVIKNGLFQRFSFEKSWLTIIMAWVHWVAQEMKTWSLYITMGLYHPLDGDTNLKYKLLCFLTPNKKNSKRKALAFNLNRCCHLVLGLRLILFHCLHWHTGLAYQKGWLYCWQSFLWLIPETNPINKCE